MGKRLMQTLIKNPKFDQESKHNFELIENSDNYSGCQLPIEKTESLNVDLSDHANYTRCLYGTTKYF